jgi:hypothetical protein
MAERRSLVEGLKPESGVSREAESSFVFAGKLVEGLRPEPQTQEVQQGKEKDKAGALARVPLTTRVRGDYALALKRASLERQLSGTLPNTLQEILEEALGPWLRANGYLA